MFCAITLSAQSPLKSRYTQVSNRGKVTDNTTTSIGSHVFQYGIANAFIQGIYEGQLSIKEVKQQGDFGLGAPNLIDGELTMIDGKVFQTNAYGETFEAPDSLKTPFVFVTAFKPDTVQHLTDIRAIGDLFARIEGSLPNKNSIYAIRIRGNFLKMRTRAFSPVSQKPYKPLSQLLAQQHFFNCDQANGTMIGFYMPGYLSGINIAGMHFHYLSGDFKKGGHVLDLSCVEVEVEIAAIAGFQLVVPQTADFKNYEFNLGNSHDLNVIEKGKN